MYRIAIYGPPLAGKTTLLQAFAKKRGLDIRRFDPLAGSGTATSDAPADQGLYVHDRAKAFSVATILGVYFHKESWPTLLAKADRVMLVLDPQPSRHEANRKCISALSALSQSRRSGCVVWTKNDLVNQQDIDHFSFEILAGNTVGSWPSFVTRYDDPNTLVEGLEFLIDLGI